MVAYTRGSGLGCGLEDLGSIPSLPSLHDGLLMAKRLKTMACVGEGSEC